MFDSYCIPMSPEQSAPQTPDHIITTVSETLNIPVPVIMAPGRGEEDTVFARYLSIVLIKERTSLTHRKIAGLFNRHKSVVSNALQSIDNYRATRHPKAEVIEQMFAYAG
jgi:chromosomal replication initiation ATPase DnaA